MEVFKELLLRDVIAEEYAQRIADEHGLDVNDLYIFRPSMRDAALMDKHSAIARDESKSQEQRAKAQENEIALTLIACVRNGKREKALDTEKIVSGDPTPYMHAHAVCTAVLTEFMKEQGEILKKFLKLEDQPPATPAKTPTPTPSEDSN